VRDGAVARIDTIRNEMTETDRAEAENAKAKSNG
jgi:hypothetical protein